MAPDDVKDSDSDGIERPRLKEIANRLKGVHRKCTDDSGIAGRKNAAVEALEAVLTDLDDYLDPASEPLEAEDLGLRLATVEELFEATGSHGVGQVIASIRATLTQPIEELSPTAEEPPPPRRFQPSPTSAKRRRRPRPETRKSPPSSPKKAGGRGFRWLSFTILIAGAVAVAAFVHFRRIEPGAPPPPSSEFAVNERPVSPTRSAISDSTYSLKQSGSEKDFDPHEEDMAKFTFEISLAESSLQDGDINGSLRHFAAAAAIDRQHRRVVGMGKSLIAAMLREADLAYDIGDAERAGKKLQGAQSIARGLQLEGSSPSGEQRDGSRAGFNDITPRDGGLQEAVGRTVRLTLKSRDVVFGYLIEIRDDIVILDAYSGTRGPSIDKAASILGSTIKEIRVYDGS